MIKFKNRLEIEKCFKKKFPSKHIIIQFEIIKIENGIIYFSNQTTNKLKKYKVTYNCPLSNKEVTVNFTTILRNGHYVSSIAFKKLFYKTEEYKQKLIQTHINNFGSQENYIKHWKEKTNKTMQEKYNVDWFLCRGKHYDKITNIMLDKYGEKHPILNEEIKDKIKSTMLEKHNTEWFLNRGEHYKKIEDVMLKKYGVKNNFQIIQKSTGRVSKLEVNVVDRLIEELNIKEDELFCYKTKQFRLDIDNGKWYNLDMYFPNINLVIEIHGDLWHCNPKLYKEDFLNKSYNLTAKEIWEKDKIR